MRDAKARGDCAVSGSRREIKIGIRCYKTRDEETMIQSPLYN